MGDQPDRACTIVPRQQLGPQDGVVTERQFTGYAQLPGRLRSTYPTKIPVRVRRTRTIPSQPSPQHYFFNAGIVPAVQQRTNAIEEHLPGQIRQIRKESGPQL